MTVFETQHCAQQTFQTRHKTPQCRHCIITVWGLIWTFCIVICHRSHSSSAWQSKLKTKIKGQLVKLSTMSLLEGGQLVRIVLCCHGESVQPPDCTSSLIFIHSSWRKVCFHPCLSTLDRSTKSSVLVTWKRADYLCHGTDDAQLMLPAGWANSTDPWHPISSALCDLVDDCKAQGHGAHHRSVPCAFVHVCASKLLVCTASTCFQTVDS